MEPLYYLSFDFVCAAVLRVRAFSKRPPVLSISTLDSNLRGPPSRRMTMCMLQYINIYPPITISVSILFPGPICCTAQSFYTQAHPICFSHIYSSSCRKKLLRGTSPNRIVRADQPVTPPGRGQRIGHHELRADVVLPVRGCGQLCVVPPSRDAG